MELSAIDLTVYVYNIAVVLTGGFVVMQAGIEDRILLIGVAFVLALFWTIYFRYRMVPKLAPLAAEAESEAETKADPERA